MSGVRHAAAGDDDHVDRVAAEPHLEGSELAGAVALVAEPAEVAARAAFQLGIRVLDVAKPVADPDPAPRLGARLVM